MLRFITINVRACSDNTRDYTLYIAEQTHREESFVGKYNTRGRHLHKADYLPVNPSYTDRLIIGRPSRDACTIISSSHIQLSGDVFYTRGSRRADDFKCLDFVPRQQIEMIVTLVCAYNQFHSNNKMLLADHLAHVIIKPSKRTEWIIPYISGDC